ALRPANLVSLRIQQRVQRLFDTRTNHLIYVPLQLLLIDTQRSKRRRCIFSHGGLTLGLVLGCVVTAIEPDRGHRLEMCERNVTSSRRTVAERGVTTLAVVEYLDSLEDVHHLRRQVELRLGKIRGGRAQNLVSGLG